MIIKPTYEELEQQVIELGKIASERKQVEEVLKTSGSQLRKIIDLVPYFIFVKDETGKCDGLVKR